MRALFIFAALCFVGCTKVPVAQSAPAPVPPGRFASLTPTRVASADIRQSGQRWIGPHPWSWSAAGLDHEVGFMTPAGGAVDPSVTHPSNCAYNATQHNGGPELTCKGPIPHLANWDLGATAAHGCIFLYLVNQHGTVDLSNFHAANNDGGDQNKGCNTVNGTLIDVGSCTGAVQLIFSGTLDGDAVEDKAVLPALITNNCPIAGSSLTLDNVAVLNPPGRVYSSISPTLRHVYVHGLNLTGPTVGLHGELGLSAMDPGTNWNQIVGEDVTVVFTRASQANTTAFYGVIAAGSPPGYVKMALNDVLIVTNKRPNGKGPTSAALLECSNAAKSPANCERDVSNVWIDTSGLVNNYCEAELGQIVVTGTWRNVFSLTTGRRITPKAIAGWPGCQ